MTRLLAMVASLLLTLSAAAAQQVVVRSSRTPEGRVMLGQQVQIFVDVLFPGAMPHPPRVAVPHVAGAQVFRFETQATNITARIGENQLSGQRFEFDLYPRRAGTLAVPPISVTLLNGDGDAAGTQAGGGLSIEAAAPPGLDPSGPIVAASDLKVAEHWEPAAPGRLQVGDTLSRVVTRTAPGMPGLALASLRFDAPEGVRAYAEAPQIQDRVERGEVTGTRIDRVTYVFERAGRYVLSAIDQPWWDLRAGSAHTASLPGRSVEVAAVEQRVPDRMRRLPLIAGGCGALALLAGMIAAGWRRWTAWQASPERRAFLALRAACRTADVAETYRAWQAWNRVRRQQGPYEPELARAVGKLEMAVFGAAVWTRADGACLSAAAAATRRPVRRRSRRAVLPPLNPVPSPADLRSKAGP